MIPVATFAQAHGWQPYQVRQLCQDLGIPTKASERSREDWYRLERALEQGPDWLVQKKLPLSSKFQAPTPPTEPDPIQVGDRFLLNSWFEPFDPKAFKPEWWTVTEPANEHGIYLLKSDSGNSGGMLAWQIARDEVRP